MKQAVLGWGVLGALVAGVPLQLWGAPSPPVPNFGRDILPILSDNCFACHGPDAEQAKGGLRLDRREDALRPADSGSPAIVPGHPEKSELLRRIMAGEAERMPPPDSHRPRLSPQQVDVLRRWIVAGAPWGKHWAFEKPILPPVPAGARHPIDALVRQRLIQDGLKPAPPAARETLIRRVTFDLTGLPPTPQEVREFLTDRSPGAYEKVVDRLLASPHFGERMAMWWLDLARYSDTDGYQSDETRTNWPWRDWVVDAFNRDMPFSRFTLEQFAGDLLPGATPEQKLATCFHRNHMTNGEGGRDPEESRIDYVIDRTNTVGTVWLGLTVGCAQCHTHKYDPLSQAEYYGLFSFFNSIDEDGRAGRAAKPYLSYRSPYAGRAVTEAQQLVEARKREEAEARHEAEAPFATWLEARRKEVRGGFQAWRPLRASEIRSVEGTHLAQEADGTVQAGGPNPRQDDYRIVAPVALRRVTGLRLEVLPLPNGRYSRGKSGEFILTDIKVQVRRRGSVQLRDLVMAGAIASFSADKAKNGGYGQVGDTLDDDPRNGWSTRGGPGGPHTAVYALAEPLVLAPDEELIVELRHRSTLGDASLGRFRVSVTDQPGETVRRLGPAPLEELAALGDAGPDRIPPDLRRRLFEQYLTDVPGYVIAKAALDRAERQLAEVKKGAEAVNVMVLAERPQPRDTHLLVRGVWDKKGEQVQRGVPAAIAPWPAGEAKNRLGLAKWLVSPDNPLTARVTANHVWQMLFGAGLVRTPDDFGLQGERPTHPELLDYLAVRFADGVGDRGPGARGQGLAAGGRGAGVPVEQEGYGSAARKGAREKAGYPLGGGGSRKQRTPATVGSQGSGSSFILHPSSFRTGPQPPTPGPAVGLGWSIKSLVRLIVTSETYRQSSKVTPELLRRDPENRLLARGTRFRLPAWMLRDAALRHAGLLNPALGGPPVRPYQPEGVWEEIFMGRFRYEPSQGPAQYRRTLYAFWRRSVAPTFLFDSAQRRVCEVRQYRTNTPLQALTLLNDTTYLEASRALAAGVLRASPTRSGRLGELFRRVVARAPSEPELKILDRELTRALAYYRAEPGEAARFLAFGQGKVPARLDLAEAAAYTLVASMVLNLDEAITHE